MEHPWKKPSMLVTFDVSKFLKLNDSSLVQPKNI